MSPPKASSKPKEQPSFKHPKPPMKTSTKLEPSRPAKPSHEFKPPHPAKPSHESKPSHTMPASQTAVKNYTYTNWKTTTQTQTWSYPFTHNHTWTTTATAPCNTTTLTQNTTTTTTWTTSSSTTPTTSPTTSSSTSISTVAQPQKTWFPLMARVAPPELNGQNILGASFLRSAYTFVDFDGRRVYLGQAASGNSVPHQRSVPFGDDQEEQKYFSPPLNAALPRQLAKQQDPSLGVATVSTTATVTEADATVTVPLDDGKSTQVIVFDGTSIVTSYAPTTTESKAGKSVSHIAGSLTAFVVGLSVMMMIVEW